MKKILSIFLVLLITGSTVYARRTENPASSVNGVGVMKTGSLVKVFYKASTLSNVRVTIYNASNRAVFSEVIKKVGGFLRPYNFEGLPYGEYTIEVEDNHQRTVERVDYQSEKVKQLAKLVKVSGEEGKFLLMIPNKTQNKLTIRIFSENGNLLHIEEKETNSDFMGLYNLASLESKFYFLITDEKGDAREIVY